MQGDAEKAKAARLTDYLTKPLDEDLLLMKLDEYLGKHIMANPKILIVDDEPFNVDYLDRSSRVWITIRFLPSMDKKRSLKCNPKPLTWYCWTL